jgi:hypothetical protein
MWELLPAGNVLKLTWINVRRRGYAELTRRSFTAPIPRLGGPTLGMKATLNGFRDHCDCAARAFRGAQAASLAIIIVEFEAFARPELDSSLANDP